MQKEAEYCRFWIDWIGLWGQESLQVYNIETAPWNSLRRSLLFLCSTAPTEFLPKACLLGAGLPLLGYGASISCASRRDLRTNHFLQNLIADYEDIAAELQQLWAACNKVYRVCNRIIRIMIKTCQDMSRLENLANEQNWEFEELWGSKDVSKENLASSLRTFFSLQSVLADQIMQRRYSYAQQQDRLPVWQIPSDGHVHQKLCVQLCSVQVALQTTRRIEMPRS